MAMLTKLIVNAETGESEMVALTDEELNQRVKDDAEYAKRIAEAEAKAEAKAAAQTKLAALGLTVSDLEALGL